MYCGKELDVYWEIEHIHPVARGGNNFIENLGLSCQQCNSLKGTKTIEEFRQSLVDDVIRKKNVVFFKHYTRGLGNYLTDEQEAEVYKRLIDLDFYLDRDLELTFFFERE